MRRYRRPSHSWTQSQLDLVMRKAASGNISQQNLEQLTKFFDITGLDPTVLGAPVPTREYGEKRLHRIGRVTLTKFTRADGVHFFEISIAPAPDEDASHVYAGSWNIYFTGASVKLVIARAREKYPKATKQVGEIVAFRAWMTMGELLVPMNRSNAFDLAWQGPIQTADRKPEMHDSHGLYSIKLIPQSMAEILRSWAASAVGFVGLFGRVIEHEEGYRSEKQIVRRIILQFPASPGFIKLMAERYQCDVTVDKNVLIT